MGGGGQVRQSEGMRQVGALEWMDGARALHYNLNEFGVGVGVRDG